jgi:hypothetical protein
MEEQTVRLARNMACHSGSLESHAIKQFFQKLGVLHQRGNAALFLSMQQTGPDVTSTGTNSKFH